MPDLTHSDAHKDFISGGTETATATATPDAGSTATATPDSSAAAAGSHATAAASAAGATPAQAAAAGAQAKQEFIDAQLDGKPFQIPRGVLLPHVRGGQTVYRPYDQVMREHINHNDYQAGKQRVAERMAEVARRDREFQLREATYQEREKWLGEEQERMMKALSADPDSDESRQYLDHVRLMRENPEYKARYEDSQKLRQREREDTVQGELTQHDQAVTLTQQLADYIEGTVCAADKYKGKVDADDLRVAYGRAITSGEVRFPEPNDPDFDGIVTRQVLRLADEMASRAARFTAPFEAELKAEREARAAAEAALQAGNANGEVRRQIARSQTARVAAPTGGAPPAKGGTPTTPRSPVMGGTPEARDRIGRWVKGG